MFSMSRFSQTINKKRVYLLLEHKIGNGDFGESAANSNVNNREKTNKKKPNSKDSHIHQTFKGHNI